MWDFFWPLAALIFGGLAYIWFIAYREGFDRSDGEFYAFTSICYAYSLIASAGPLIFILYITMNCFGCEANHD